MPCRVGPQSAHIVDTEICCWTTKFLCLDHLARRVVVHSFGGPIVRLPFWCALRISMTRKGHNGHGIVKRSLLLGLRKNIIHRKKQILYMPCNVHKLLLVPVLWSLAFPTSILTWHFKKWYLLTCIVSRSENHANKSIVACKDQCCVDNKDHL